ncbi:hypothetical protein [Ekhidna sp.]|uniref:hypothetical protein n=1 Tax=Ekhidna sp. TaxID=2608089 RepID=UPI00329833C5
MKALKYAPSCYIGSDEESVASVINIGYFLLPIFLIVVLIRQLIQGDIDLAIVIGVSLFFSLYVRHQFLNGHLRRSVVSVVIFFNLLLTVACSLGNGINDIGIIGYPIIIGFSGITLDQKKLAMTSTLSIIGIVWLVAAERFDIYESIPVPIGSGGDFLVSSLLIIIGGFVAFSLTSNMKRALKSAQNEIFISKNDAENLERESNEKLEIIEEIHRAVINSLQHIQQLIAHKQNNAKELTPVYTSLKRKVLVIEVAHNILLSDQAPIMLDIRELTRQLLNEYEKDLKSPAIHIDAGNISHLVRLDLAINYGICLLELINEVDNYDNEMLRAKLTIAKETINVKLTGFKTTNEQQGIVIELLTKQLKGSLIKNTSEYHLTFPNE